MENSALDVIKEFCLDLLGLKEFNCLDWLVCHGAQWFGGEKFHDSIFNIISLIHHMSTSRQIRT